MKFTISWLRDHLEFESGIEILLHRLTMIGLEVEKATNKSDGLESFVVGHVKEVVQHPNADNLKVCQVDNGSAIFEVVCGAPNARAGLKSVFAAEGSFIPGTGVKLKKTTIRDIESCGMLLSERELGLSDEHEGIIELPGGSPIGESIVDIMTLNDPIIEIAITPNRGDCLGVRGIARDLAASGFGSLKDLNTKSVEGTFESPHRVVLDLNNEMRNACPYFIGRTLKGVKNTESPKWMKERLVAVGLRPVSVLVDVTNYLTFDLGRPLHVFDAGKIKGDIRVRMAVGGECIHALDGKQYSLDTEICVVADDNGPESLGGVMGGEESGCSQMTTDIFVESAYFDPIRTAITGRKLNILSDARYRFERGVDPAFLKEGMEIATRLIMDICGGEASHLVTAGAEPKWGRKVTMRADRPKTLGGVDITEDEIEKILTNLGFKVSYNGVIFSADVPSWRNDITSESCLVEEVLRLHGFDKIPVVTLPRKEPLPGVALSSQNRRQSQARRALAARGMTEIVTYSFLAKTDAKRFGGANEKLFVTNPISAELDVMRPSLLPNLIDAAARNGTRGIENTQFFEVGPQFTGDTPDEQAIVASGLRSGYSSSRHWTESRRPVDTFDVKADALAILADLGVTTSRLQVVANAPDYYHPGRSGVIRQGPTNILAYFGEIHPSVLRKMDLDSSACGFEVYLDNIPGPRSRGGTARLPLKLSRYQKVERDFAFIVDQDISAQEIFLAATSADKTLITDVNIFDVFSGGAFDKGQKSIAFTITLQPRKNTLSESEIETVSAKVIENVEKRTAAKLRTS